MQNYLNNLFFPDEFSAKQKANSAYEFSYSFWLAIFQLCLCTIIIVFAGIEQNQGLPQAAIVFTGGFFIYSFLPLLYRKSFLFLITVAGLFSVWGWSIALVAVGIVMIFTSFTFIKNRPIRFLLAFSITFFAIALTFRWVQLPFLRIVFNAAAVFLMIRYYYLLFELKYYKGRVSFIDRLNYLLLLPNAVFPLMPPLDPKVMFNGFYSVTSEATTKKALVWITRGIVHTFLYRVVYVYCSPSPYEIESAADYWLFAISGYAYLLRLSGLFYMALGFIMLYGYNLPAIFNNYFFTRSFADFWNRINLYWQSFMARIVYFPLLKRLKGIPLHYGVLLTTMFLFILSWILHAWQWFWIKSGFTFQWNDVLFWTFLGVCISIGAFIKIKRNKLSTQQFGWFTSIKHVFSIATTFLLMSLVWSMWTAGSLNEWMYLTGNFAFQTGNNDWIILLIAAGAIVLGTVINYLHFNKNFFVWFFKDTHQVLSILLLMVVTFSIVYIKYNPRKYNVEQLVHLNLNERDKKNMERGYYEQLLNNDEKQIELFNLSGKRPVWQLDTSALRFTNTILLREFKPNVKVAFKGDSLSINSLGIRDKEYSIQKPSNTHRLVILGGSYEMGSGVGDHENYPALLEAELNKNPAKDVKIELLNFGAGGYHLPQSVYITNTRIKKVDPDVVIYVAHSQEMQRATEAIIKIVDKGAKITDSELNEIVRQSGIKKSMCAIEKYNCLKPFSTRIINWGYRSISNWCNKNDAKAVWVYLPVSAGFIDSKEEKTVQEIAQKNGFDVINLSKVYEGYNPELIQLTSWDAHPNQLGHRLIAKQLYNEFIKKPYIYKK